MAPRRMIFVAACGLMCASALTLGAPSAVASLHATTPHWRVLARTPGSLGAIVAPTTQPPYVVPRKTAPELRPRKAQRAGRG